MLDLVIFLPEIITLYSGALEIITLHLGVLNFALLKFLSSCNLILGLFQSVTSVPIRKDIKCHVQYYNC